MLIYVNSYRRLFLNIEILIEIRRNSLQKCLNPQMWGLLYWNKEDGLGQVLSGKVYLPPGEHGRRINWFLEPSATFEVPCKLNIWF